MSQRGMDQFQQIVRNIGAKNAEKLAKSLGVGKKFHDVFYGELGQMLLEELIETITSQTQHLVNGKYEPYSPEETDCRAEVRVSKRILDRWMKKLANYENELERWDKNSRPRS